MNIMKNVKGTLILSFTALIWGLAFVAQSDAADLVPPFLFNSLRCFIGALFLFLFSLIRTGVKKVPLLPASGGNRKPLWKAGFACGILLTICVNFQQFGLTLYPQGVASSARGGFLTALYVVMVPLLSLFFGKRPRLAEVGAVPIAMCGIYLLCLADGIQSVYLGDVMMLGCALSFALHIFAVDHFGRTEDGISLSMLQFLTCGILSGIVSLITETPTWEGLSASIPHILYLGIVSSGIGYTLQIIGQRHADPAMASLSMSLEGVFAALGGWLLLGDRLQAREIWGCGLVFLSILLAQLPQIILDRKKKQKIQSQTDDNEPIR